MNGWLPELEQYLHTENGKLPSFWSADFIMKDDGRNYDGSQDVCEYADQAASALSEISCSCLGFRQNSFQIIIEVHIL